MEDIKNVGGGENGTFSDTTFSTDSSVDSLLAKALASGRDECGGGGLAMRDEHQPIPTKISQRAERQSEQLIQDEFQSQSSQHDLSKAKRMCFQCANCTQCTLPPTAVSTAAAQMQQQFAAPAVSNHLTEVTPSSSDISRARQNLLYHNIDPTSVPSFAQIQTGHGRVQKQRKKPTAKRAKPVKKRKPTHKRKQAAKKKKKSGGKKRK